MSDPSLPPRKRLSRPVHWALDGLGATLVAVGAVGIVTPGLPTTVFWIGAVMCFLLFMSLMSKAATRNFFIPYVGVGILIYFVYGMWNSKLAKGETVLGHEPNPDLAATKTGD